MCCPSSVTRHIVALAGDTHQTAETPEYEVITGSGAIGACLTEPGDRTVDDARVDFPDMVVAQLGDETRGWGPPWLKDGKGRDTADSTYFASTNRGKKAITVDIAKPGGQAVVRQLAAVSDVLIENYKVGTLARYGTASSRSPV